MRANSPKQTALQISRMRMMDVVLAVRGCGGAGRDVLFALRAAPKRPRSGWGRSCDPMPSISQAHGRCRLRSSWWWSDSWRRSFGCLRRGERLRWRQSLVTGTSFGYFVGFERGGGAWAVRRQILHELVARSEPVVMAVDAYVRANHRPPARWSNLVPGISSRGTSDWHCHPSTVRFDRRALPLNRRWRESLGHPTGHFRVGRPAMG